MSIEDHPLSKGLLNAQGTIAIAASIFITLGVAAASILRYVFKTSLFGLEELILIAAFWMYFMGASYAASRKQHISAEIVSVYCKNRKAREIMILIAEFITLALSLLYTYWGAYFVYWGVTEGGTTPVYRLPIAVSQFAIFLGFVLMTWYFLLDVVRRTKGIVADEQETPT